jgi:ABC-2 type transport system permease protein
MKGFRAALYAESLKVKRSKVLLATIIFFIFTAVMMGMLVVVAKHPELAGKSALLKSKASFVGKADWPAFFGLLNQVIMSAGTVGFGIVASYVFGREYSDRVVKDLLALPVSRMEIVLSKFLIVFVWGVFLSLVFFASGLTTGIIANIEGWSYDLAIQEFILFEGGAILTVLLCTPVAFLASYSRGYLLPIAFIILIIMVTQVAFMGVPEWTPYFPWALPALFCQIAGAATPELNLWSYLIYCAACFLGLMATISWWRFADQN